MLLLIGCGSGDDGLAKTGAAKLFKTPPAGFEYTRAHKEVLARIESGFARVPTLSKDDLAVREVVREGSSTPVGLAVAIDAHAMGGPRVIRDTFAKGFETQGSQVPEDIRLAGTPATLGKYKRAYGAIAAKNRYALAAFGPDAGDAKVLLARLITAARRAER